MFLLLCSFVWFEIKWSSKKPVKLIGENIIQLVKIDKQRFFTKYWHLTQIWFFRYNANKAAEDAIRDYEAKMKPIWDAEKAAKAAKENREGMIKLAREVGVKVPENY